MQAEGGICQACLGSYAEAPPLLFKERASRRRNLQACLGSYAEAQPILSKDSESRAKNNQTCLKLFFRDAACLMNAVVLRLRVAEICEIGKYAVKLVCAVERRGNVLLCRAIARIGEVPQAEGFGNGSGLRV